MLRNKVAIQSVIETRDDAGGVIESWVLFKSAWASIEPLLGREFFESKQINADISVKIRIRAVIGVTPKMRVVFGTRIFEILSVANVKEVGREMILMCREDV